MNEYITHVIIAGKEKTKWPGDRVQLTDEQAAAYGKNVSLAEIAAPDKPLEEKTVKELRGLAKTAGVAGYWDLSKEALVTELKAVGDDEPTSG